MRVCKARLRQLARWRPAALAHVTIVQGPSSLLHASVVPLAACRWRKIRVASRGASVAAAFKIPAPTARQTSHASNPSDHNTQRLLPDQKRLLERRVPPNHICQTSERRGEPRAVPPHRNHVRPVAPLIIQRMVVAAPQR